MSRITSEVTSKIRFNVARMKAAVVSLLIGFALFVPSAGAAVIELDFNSLPSAQGWTYSTSAGSNEQDVFSVDGSALHQNSVGLLDDPIYVWQGTVERAPFDVRFRARVTEFEGPRPRAWAFSVLVGTVDFFVYVGLGPGFVEIEENVVGNPRLFIDTSQFHDYRLLGDPVAGSYRFFVDGIELLTRTIGHNPLGSNLLMIGDRTLAEGPFPTFSAVGAKADLSYFLFDYLTTQVVIDIKPQSSPNSLNPRSRGKIPVAILTTDSFDASTVDATRVLFGETGSEATMVHGALEDVDGDGDLDLILHFNTQDAGIDCGTTSASLTGVTIDGTAIQGADAIEIVGCR